MPTPQQGESRKKFVHRCIPIVMKDGTAKDNKQAVAICYSIFNQHKKKGKKEVKNMQLEQITFNLDTALLREEMLDGELHWVVPMALMGECVANGSQGALFYPAEELKKWAPAWNHKPLVLNHPTTGSANTPEFLNTNKFGIVLNTKWDRKQRAEGWFNQRKTQQIAPEIARRIVNREMIELSTGLYVNAVPEEADYNGKHYTARAVDHRPDHVAILPKDKGAYSIKDGGGVFQLNQLSHEEIRNDLEKALNEYYADQIDSMPALYCWIRSVFDDSCIYCFGGKMYQIGYQRSEDEITLVGEPTEVEQKVEYVPVGNADPKSGEIDMAKKELVDALISNSTTQFEESDRKFLEGLSEDQLKKFSPKEVKNEAKFKFATQEEMDAAVQKGVQEALAKDLQTKNKENDPPKTDESKLSPEAWLAAMPPEFRTVHNNAVRALRTETERCVSLIMNSKQNKFTKEQLEKMDLETLQNMASLIQAPAGSPGASPEEQYVASYFGAGGFIPTLNSQAKPEEDPLTMPAYNTEKFASAGK